MCAGPKARERPVAGWVMIDADSEGPTFENSASRSSLVVLNGRFPTYSFLPIAIAPGPSGPFDGQLALTELPVRVARHRTRRRRDGLLLRGRLTRNRRRRLAQRVRGEPPFVALLVGAYAIARPACAERPPGQN